MVMLNNFEIAICTSNNSTTI